jgi:hypothetical protein
MKCAGLNILPGQPAQNLHKRWIEIPFSDHQAEARSRGGRREVLEPAKDEMAMDERSEFRLFSDTLVISL